MKDFFDNHQNLISIIFVSLGVLIAFFIVLITVNSTVKVQEQNLVCYNQVGTKILDTRVDSVYFGSSYVRYYKDGYAYGVSGSSCVSSL